MKRFGSILLVLAISALGLAGCAHKETSTASTAPAAAAAPAQKTAPAPKAPAAAPAPAKPVKGAPAPAGTKLARVQKDMSPDQVREIMGAPTSEHSYVTAKRFIPYYYGADAGQNTEWKYKGVGRVVFGVNKYTGTTRVIRIDSDPSEDGQ
jgi:outer membrane protein assembly factor BamE (lipoprotein component of BamABCDE complex)